MKNEKSRKKQWESLKKKPNFSLCHPAEGARKTIYFFPEKNLSWKFLLSLPIISHTWSVRLAKKVWKMGKKTGFSVSGAHWFRALSLLPHGKFLLCWCGMMMRRVLETKQVFDLSVSSQYIPFLAVYFSTTLLNKAYSNSILTSVHSVSSSFITRFQLQLIPFFLAFPFSKRRCFASVAHFDEWSPGIRLLVHCFIILRWLWLIPKYIQLKTLRWTSNQKPGSSPGWFSEFLNFESHFRIFQNPEFQIPCLF